MKQLYNF